MAAQVLEAWFAVWGICAALYFRWTTSVLGGTWEWQSGRVAGAAQSGQSGRVR